MKRHDKGSAFRSQSPKRPVFTDIGSLFTQFEKLGESIIYLRDGFLPVIRADVLLKEKSREQMGDIEKTILSLIGAGLASIESVSTAMGMAAHRLTPIMKELGGRGLIRIDGERLGLRELGLLSLEYGAVVVEVPRSFLLSGLDGQLLPRSFYSAQRIEVASLPDYARMGELLDPARRIPLNALDISGIENRHDLNIPHEALSITKLVSHEPLFIRGKLIVSAASQRVHTARFVSGTTELAISDPYMVMNLLEPLGFSANNKTSEMVLNEIVASLESLGSVKVGRAHLDYFGNPEVFVHDVLPPFEAIKVDGLPLLAHMATRDRSGVPIQRFPFTGKNGADMLRGRTLTIKAGDSATDQRARKFRQSVDAIDAFYKLSKAERPDSFAVYLENKIAPKSWTIEEIAVLARQINYPRLSKILAAEGEH